MELSKLELLFLRRLVDENLDAVERRINRLIRLSGRDSGFHEKMAIAESEKVAMEGLMGKINDEIAVRELTTVRN